MRSGPEAPLPPRSAAAIASLVLALLWICGIGSLAAIVLGIIGIRATRAGRQRGRGVAVAGLVVGALGLLLAIGSSIAVWSFADETFIVQADERDDVRLLSCGRSADGRGSAELVVTNDSSETSSYLITVSFRVDARETLAELVTVSDVAPAASREFSVRSAASLIGTAEPECSVVFVQRYRAG